MPVELDEHNPFLPSPIHPQFLYRYTLLVGKRLCSWQNPLLRQMLCSRVSDAFFSILRNSYRLVIIIVLLSIVFEFLIQFFSFPSSRGKVRMRIGYEGESSIRYQVILT
jgi:hypothetical protein